MHDLKEYRAGQEPWTKQVKPLVTCRALSTVEIIDHVPKVQNTVGDIRWPMNNFVLIIMRLDT